MPLREDPTYHVGGLTKNDLSLLLAPLPTLPILDFISDIPFGEWLFRARTGTRCTQAINAPSALRDGHSATVICCYSMYAQ